MLRVKLGKAPRSHSISLSQKVRQKRSVLSGQKLRKNWKMCSFYKEKFLFKKRDIWKKLSEESVMTLACLYARSDEADVEERYELKIKI